MSDPITSAQLCKLMGTNWIAVQVIYGKETKTYTIHFDLLNSVTDAFKEYFDCTPRDTPRPCMPIYSVGAATFEVFVSWLYSTSRSTHLEDLRLEANLLVRVWVFADNYSIQALRTDAAQALTKYNNHFAALERAFDVGSDNLKLQISCLLETQYSKTPLPKECSLESLLCIYLFGLKLYSPLLKNRAMDAIRLKMEDKLCFNFQQVKDIFEHTAAYSNEEARIRTYCVALLFYQQSEACFDDDRNYLTPKNFKLFNVISGLGELYEDWENIIIIGNRVKIHDREDLDDPRDAIGWSRCFFHHHLEGKDCYFNHAGEEIWAEEDSDEGMEEDEGYEDEENDGDGEDDGEEDDEENDEEDGEEDGEDEETKET